jgi:hypothetical protein
MQSYRIFRRDLLLGSGDAIYHVDSLQTALNQLNT